jgi:hypothetical protein
MIFIKNILHTLTIPKNKARPQKMCRYFCNSPGACHNNPAGRHLITPTSNHPAGVLATRIDGSVFLFQKQLIAAIHCQ